MISWTCRKDSKGLDCTGIDNTAVLHDGRSIKEWYEQSSIPNNAKVYEALWMMWIITNQDQYKELVSMVSKYNNCLYDGSNELMNPASTLAILINELESK